MTRSNSGVMERSPRTRLAPDLLRWKARLGVSRPQTQRAFWQDTEIF